jgi:hypothetical protein
LSLLSLREFILIAIRPSFADHTSYLLLIPLNLFGLALPTTTALCLLPASLLAIQRLEKSGVDSKSDDDEAKDLLSYFVVLGFVQFVESAMAGFLERRIRECFGLTT